MDSRMKPTFWDRAELLETVKEFHQKLHGVRPEAGLYDELEIKASSSCKMLTTHSSSREPFTSVSDCACAAE